MRGVPCVNRGKEPLPLILSLERTVLPAETSIWYTETQSSTSFWPAYRICLMDLNSKRRQSHHYLHRQSDELLVMIQIWIQTLTSRNKCVDLGLIHVWSVSWMWIRIIFKQGCNTTRGQIFIKIAILVGLIPGNICYNVWRHRDKFQRWTYFINFFFFIFFFRFIKSEFCMWVGLGPLNKS